MPPRRRKGGHPRIPRPASPGVRAKTDIGRLVHEGFEHHRTGRMPEAVACYRQALEADPRQPDALNLLGMAEFQEGRYEPAAELISRAIAARPREASFRNNLGTVLEASGEREQALAAFRKAAELAPALAEAQNNLGKVLIDLGDAAAAEAHCLKAITAKPDYAEAHMNLGVALAALDRHAEAVSAFRRAIVLAPGHARAMNNLAVSLMALDQPAAAAAVLGELCRRLPEDVALRLNLAAALRERGDITGAIAVCREAMALDPQAPAPHYHLAHALFLAGRIPEAWAEFEWRLRMPDFPGGAPFQNRTLPAVSELAGRDVLVLAEQGFGDTIQFARFLDRLAGRGARVWFRCQRDLTRLFRCLGEQVRLCEPDGPLPAHDALVPLMSLPRILEVGEEVGAAPYVRAEPGLVERWRGRLSPADGPRIGIVWAGTRTHRNDRKRSVRCADLLAVFERRGLSAYGLQKNGDEPALAKGGHRDLAPWLEDFADTAAALEALDLLVSVDTSVAHLAGALGRPALVLLPFAPDWRWWGDGEATPWYPSVRLLRQPRPGDWRSVLAALDRALEGFLGTR